MYVIKEYAFLGLQGATATHRSPWSEIDKEHLINAHKDGSPHHLEIARCQFPIRTAERQDAHGAQVSQRGDEDPIVIPEDFGSVICQPIFSPVFWMPYLNQCILG